MIVKSKEESSLAPLPTFHTLKWSGNTSIYHSYTLHIYVQPKSDCCVHVVLVVHTTEQRSSPSTNKPALVFNDMLAPKSPLASPLMHIGQTNSQFYPVVMCLPYLLKRFYEILCYIHKQLSKYIGIFTFAFNFTRLRERFTIDYNN